MKIAHVVRIACLCSTIPLNLVAMGKVEEEAHKVTHEVHEVVHKVEEKVEGLFHHHPHHHSAASSSHAAASSSHSAPATVSSEHTTLPAAVIPATSPSAVHAPVLKLEELDSAPSRVATMPAAATPVVLGAGPSARQTNASSAESTLTPQVPAAPAAGGVKYGIQHAIAAVGQKCTTLRNWVTNPANRYKFAGIVVATALSTYLLYRLAQYLKAEDEEAREVDLMMQKYLATDAGAYKSGYNAPVLEDHWACQQPATTKSGTNSTVVTSPA